MLLKTKKSKKYQTGKRHDMMAYEDTGLKKFSSIHDRLTMERKKMPTR